MALSLTPQQIVDKDEYDLLKIASSWLRVPLLNVATVQNGFAFKSEFFDRTEGMPLIRIRDVTKEDTEHRYRGEYLEEYVVRKGDILVGMDGDFKAAKWRGLDALLNQRVCRLAITSNFYDQDFFFLCLQPYLNAINAETSSVTVKHLSSKSVQAIPLPLPPINEQRRIVEKIEKLFAELDKGEESLEAAKARAGLYRQSLLKHAFEGHLTADWRAANPDKLEDPETLLTRIQNERDARYQQALDDWQVALEKWRDEGEESKKPAKPKRLPEVVQPTADELNETTKLPKGWAYFHVASLCEVVRGGSPRPAGDIRYYDGDIPFLKVADLTRGRGLYVDSFTYTIKPAGLSKTRQVEPNTLLISNSGATLGVPKICRIKATFNDGIAAFLGLDEVDQSYQYWFWTSKTHHLRQINQGAAQPNLNTGIIGDTLIPVCSKEEQSELVARLDAKLSILDAVQRQLDEQLARSKALRQSILKRAFAGELVAQDPNDEPASKLLERIKAEKAKAEIAAKRDRTTKPVRKPKNRRPTMTDLIEVLKKAGEWVSASKAAQELGIADGTSSDDVEAFYRQLKERIEAKEIEVERRGDEDWLRLAKVEAT